MLHGTFKSTRNISKKCNIQIEHMQHLSQTLATLQHLDLLCNIHMKHLKHSFETSETLETCVCNMKQKPGRSTIGRHKLGGSHLAASQGSSIRCEQAAQLELHCPMPGRGRSNIPALAVEGASVSYASSGDRAQPHPGLGGTTVPHR
jgi:hypothetical protein